jgi:hypothetical protein
MNQNLPVGDNIYVREENVRNKAFQKRKKREQKTIKECKIPGVVGKPPFVNNETAEIIKKRLKEI